MSNIYERVLELTTRNNLNGVKLGEMLGLKKSPLTDWKNQKSKPTLDQFEKLCEIFAVSPEYLLTGKDASDLTPEEQLLVNHFRHADNRAQESILQYAESESARHPKPDNSEQLFGEQQSSTSKIG